MNDQTPPPDEGVRVEHDFVRPLTPVKNASRRRLPAAVPIALAGLLVVASVAFGANVLAPMVGAPDPDATPIVIGDEEPEPTPAPVVTLTPTEAPALFTEAPVEPTEPPAEPTEQPVEPEPTDPAIVSLSLSVSIVDGKVKLAWGKYEGDFFAYYKVVRSSDASVSWPAGGNDTLVAAISSQAQTTALDAAPKGHTFSYRVFAVRSGDEGYAILGQSAVKTIAVPAPATTPPTAPPSTTLGTLRIVDNGGGSYTFKWTPYTGDGFTYYKLVHGPVGSAPSYPQSSYWWVGSDKAASSWTGKIASGDYAVRMQAVDYVDGQVVIRAQTNIVRLTVQASQPACGTAQDLGAISATKNADGTYTLSWNAYTGPIDFSYYKLTGEPAGTNPAYTETGHYWAVVDGGSHSWTGKIAAGSWWIRVQAIYYPDGACAAGQTRRLDLTVAAAATATPKPTPVTISLAATPAAGGVNLVWGKYTGDGFQYYKVVRSETNSSPTYPENAGTVLIAAINNVGTVSMTDTEVVPGKTYYYRVVVYNVDSGQVLGKSAVRTVTIPAA